MKKFINLIKKKWLINSTKTFLLVIILLVLFIAINYGINQLDLTPIDLTENKLYSLTDESIEKIKDIDKEINIYFFGYNKNDSSIDLAKQYHKENENIKIIVADPSIDYTLYNKYSVDEQSEGIVVECGEKSKILPSSDFYSFDYTTYEEIDQTEQTLTSAILNIVAEEKPQVFFLSGHSEKLSKLTTFKTFLANDINDVNDLDLLVNDFPEKCNCLILTTPESDYNELETNKIKSYINNGGNILCLIDSFSKDFVNLQSILDLYGVSISDGIITDTDSYRIVANDDRFLIPDLSYHKITEYIISDGNIMLMKTSKLNLADDEKLSDLNVVPNTLIESSDTSILSTSNENGPFTIGAELIKTINTDDEDNVVESKLIIYSDLMFAQDSATIANQNTIPFTIYSNKDLLLNSVAYLSERDSSITIRKDTNSVTYTATEQENNIVLIIIFAFPILIILLGIIVGIIRKRRK